MPCAVPHLLRRIWTCLSRGALHPLRPLLAAFALAGSAVLCLADTIASARYGDPTERYTHGILGDAIEWGSLELVLTDGTTLTFDLPQDHVFEDVAPRLVDVDSDGAPEVLVVETDVGVGAALALYDVRGKLTETPHIGTRNRWLAPLGAADLDGDGSVEIAYIDRPHLTKTLRIWRFVDGALVPVGELPGVTNHRIGETDIAGGIRTCEGAPELILATADWGRLVAISWTHGSFIVTELGRDTSRPAFARAMVCAD